MHGLPPLPSINRNNKNSKHHSMAPPDVTFIFAEDVLEWDAYLSRQFEGSGTTIHHEQVEKMTFPVTCSKIPVFSEARVVLVILSPALVNFLDTRASDGFQFTKLLKASKTIAMLCGVTGSNLSGIKDVLISYDEWRHLEAKDKDINMVRNVIELIHDMLAQSKENERINKPKFKLIPRKVQEGNGKVYVLLAKPIDNNAQLRIILEASCVREVPVKKRNPYTLVFVIPDELMLAQNMVNVQVWNGENLLGISSVKCVSKMGEIYSLLSSVVSPYEFLCNTLGMASLHDVDSHLTSSFKKNLPQSGFDLLNDDVKIDRLRKSKEEYPTLLHFASRHGLCQLVEELLKCPSARSATMLRNAKGLTPAQLANHAGHNEVVTIIDEFLKSRQSPSEQLLDSIVPPPVAPENERKLSNPLDYYDIPSHPVPVLHLPLNRNIGSVSSDKESDYLKMKGSHKENIEPPQTFEIQDKQELNDDVFKPRPNPEKKLSLLESQARLIDIMEAYKKGASLLEVEKMHNEWKALYQVSDMEAKSTLDGLRSLYAKAQKAKLNKKHSSSFSELRQFFNNKLRRKESIGSKCSFVRKYSKDNTAEKLPEPETMRPVSTLSVLSNTSSSSGSSFDRLSTVSAGSDSGHHSDFGDDKNKIKDIRYHQQPRALNSPSNVANLQNNFHSLTLNNRPPAPPPRPTKTVARYGSLEDCKSDFPQYAVSKKSLQSFKDTLTLFDCVPPNPKSSTIGSDFMQRKASLDFPFEGPNSNYDCPPPPRPSISSAKMSIKNSLFAPVCDPKTDYDIVPPPLPVSSPPAKKDISLLDLDLSYDIPNSVSASQPFQRSNSISSTYDFPKTTIMDNTDTQATCTCQVAPNKNNVSSVKSCCIGNKLSSLNQIDNLPSVPNSDIIFNIEKESKSVNDSRSAKNQYYNVCLRSPREMDVSHRVSMPEEMAPPPPIIESECLEEHYKMVSAPIPIPATNKIS